MPYGHASMLLLGEGSEATEPYNKYDKSRPHSIRSLQFDQKVRPLSFRPENQRNLCNQDFEIVTCRVLSLNYPIIFICCYRPPSGNSQLFLEEFYGLLVKFSSEYILFRGDFNIHVNRICPASTDSKDIFDEFGLVQSVELPTHKSGNTLDLVIGPQKFEMCC